MTDQRHQPRIRSPRKRVLAVIALILAMLSIGAVDATTASADANAHTIVVNTPESLGADYSQPSYFLNSNVNVTISCYVTSDVVTGPYGPSNVWDELSGGGTGARAGTFVPDADIYTGSNSPVVPPCSTVRGQVIGGNEVYSRSGPDTADSTVYGVFSGQHVEIKCYTTGSPVSGPYGTEHIWDLLTLSYYGQAWVPDALIYTGSNSAVVSHC